MGFDTGQQKKIRRYGIGPMIREDPAMGLALLGDYDFSDDDKRNMFRTTFFKDRNQEDLVAMRGALRNPDDLVLLEKAIRDHDAKREFLPKNVKTSDEVQVGLKNGQISEIASITMYWDSEQKSRLAEAFATFDDDAKNKIATRPGAERAEIESFL